MKIGVQNEMGRRLFTSPGLVPPLTHRDPSVIRLSDERLAVGLRSPGGDSTMAAHGKDHEGRSP